MVANGNEDEPNISIEFESRVLNETTDRDREEEDDADLEIDEATDVQGVFNGKSLKVLLKIPELIHVIVPSFFGRMTCL